MATTNFTDFETTIEASWLNDVDYLVYSLFNYVDGQTSLTIDTPIDAGDPGLEEAGINVNGVTYAAGLRVNDIGGTNAAQFVIHRHSTTLQPLILGARANSDTSAHAAVTAGQSLFSIFGSGYTGSHYDLFGELQFQVGTGTVSATSSPGRLVLNLAPDGSNIPAAVLTLDSDKSAVFTGPITTTDLTLSAANPEILGGDTDGVLYIAPSTTNALGGNILLYGDTHATKAKDIEFRATAGVELHYDDSGSLWDFQANAVTTIGDVTGLTINATGDTSAGDNAVMGYTATEGLILTGQGSTNDVTVKNDADADVLVIPTGTTNVDIVGVATAATFEPDGDTSAGDPAAIGYTAAEGLILTGQGSTSDLTIKNDADTTVFSIPTGTQNVDFAAGTKLLVDRTTDDAAFVNFQATIDGDATSAISSLTTSGAVTHHIQIELNGTTAWIPVSTTDPS